MFGDFLLLFSVLGGGKCGPLIDSICGPLTCLSVKWWSRFFLPIGSPYFSLSLSLSLSLYPSDVLPSPKQSE